WCNLRTQAFRAPQRILLLKVTFRTGAAQAVAAVQEGIGPAYLATRIAVNARTTLRRTRTRCCLLILASSGNRTVSQRIHVNRGGCQPEAALRLAARWRSPSRS